MSLIMDSSDVLYSTVMLVYTSKSLGTPSSSINTSVSSNRIISSERSGIAREEAQGIGMVDGLNEFVGY